jgi:hypothetical protein
MKKPDMKKVACRGATGHQFTIPEEGRKEENAKCDHGINNGRPAQTLGMQNAMSERASIVFWSFPAYSKQRTQRLL